MYCGRTDELTDEHLIPYSLDGNYVLPKSVCAYHHNLTSKMDQVCTRSMLGGWRTRLQMQTTKPDDRVREVDLYQIETANDLSARPLGKGASELFASLALPVYPFPRLLSGAPVTKGTATWPVISLWVCRPPPILPGTERIFGRGPIEAELFGRMVAKIAFGLTMAAFAGRFRPLIKDVILGHDSDPNRLVGTDTRRWPRDQHVHWHGWNLRPGSDGNTYLLCSVRLFNGFGAPLYNVVVGDQLEGFADDAALTAHARTLPGGGAHFLTLSADGTTITSEAPDVDKANSDEPARASFDTSEN